MSGRISDGMSPKLPQTNCPVGALAPDGRTLWTTDTGATTISAFRPRDLVHRRTIDVGAAPIDIALSPSGRTALVTTGFYDKPGLAVVDLAAGKVLGHADAGPHP